MTTYYYEAIGSLRSELLELLDKRRHGIKLLIAFAKRHGGQCGTSDSAFGLTFRLMSDKPPKNHEHWKCHRDYKDQWSPRHSTKVGKALDAEIRQIVRDIPSGPQLSKAIGHNGFDGLRWSMPGVAVVGKGKRVLVAVGEQKLKPKNPVELVRISDLDYERLTAAKAKK